MGGKVRAHVRSYRVERHQPAHPQTHGWAGLAWVGPGHQCRQMSRTPWVEWSFAFPSGSAIRPSIAIAEFQ